MLWIQVESSDMYWVRNFFGMLMIESKELTMKLKCLSDGKIFIMSRYSFLYDEFKQRCLLYQSAWCVWMCTAVDVSNNSPSSDMYSKCIECTKEKEVKKVLWNEIRASKREKKEGIKMISAN